MESLNEEQRRRLVIQYKIDHPELNNNSVAKYFAEIGVPRSTVYSILKRYADDGDVAAARSAGSGRPAIKVTDRVKTRIEEDARKGLSQREISRKY